MNMSLTGLAFPIGFSLLAIVSDTKLIKRGQSKKNKAELEELSTVLFCIAGVECVVLAAPLFLKNWGSIVILAVGIVALLKYDSAIDKIGDWIHNRHTAVMLFFLIMIATIRASFYAIAYPTLVRTILMTWSATLRGTSDWWSIAILAVGLIILRYCRDIAVNICDRFTLLPVTKYRTRSAIAVVAIGVILVIFAGDSLIHEISPTETVLYIAFGCGFLMVWAYTVSDEFGKNTRGYVMAAAWWFIMGWIGSGGVASIIVLGASSKIIQANSIAYKWTNTGDIQIHSFFDREVRIWNSDKRLNGAKIECLDQNKGMLIGHKTRDIKWSISTETWGDQDDWKLRNEFFGPAGMVPYIQSQLADNSQFELLVLALRNQADPAQQQLFSEKMKELFNPALEKYKIRIVSAKYSWTWPPSE